MNPNDSAFPVVSGDLLYVTEYGLTKRELFAAMAMQGMGPFRGLALENEPLSIKKRALKAVRMSDALIEALREKEKSE